MGDYSVAPRKEVAAQVEKMDFDSVVLITYDRHTNRLQNWWHFSGHPDSWTAADMSSIAQQMASHTAELLKADANTPKGREVVITAKRSFNFLSKTREFGYLGGFVVHGPKYGDRICAVLYWSMKAVGLSVAWSRTEEVDRVRRSISFLVGPLNFTFALDRAR